MNIQELENFLKDYQKYLPESNEGKQKKSQLIGYLSSSYWWHSQYITSCSELQTSGDETANKPILKPH